jgi:hypothetical protein
MQSGMSIEARAKSFKELYKKKVTSYTVRELYRAAGIKKKGIKRSKPLWT